MSTTAEVPAARYDADSVYRSLHQAAAILSDPGFTITDLLFRCAEAYPSALALALVDAATGRALGFAGLRSAILSIAFALASHAGVRPGDAIRLVAPNNVLYPVCFCAATPLGAVATTANPLYTPREIAKQAADARVKLLITLPKLLPKVAGLGLPVIHIHSPTFGRHALLRPRVCRRRGRHNEKLVVYDHILHLAFHDLLHDSGFESRLVLTWPRRHKMALGVVRALAYLH